MKRITIIAQNQPGVVADITSVLAARDVNIETIDIDALDESGVINLTVDRYDEALRALAEGGFSAVSEDALVIRVKDEPGAIARIAARFKDRQVNIRSLHILRRLEEHSLASLVADDPAAARDLVREELVSGE